MMLILLHNLYYFIKSFSINKWVQYDIIYQGISQYMTKSLEQDFIQMQIDYYFNDPQTITALKKEKDVDQALYSLVKELSSEYSRNNDIKEDTKEFSNIMKKYGKKIEKIAKAKNISQDFSYDEMRFSEKLQQAMGKIDPQDKTSTVKALISKTKDPKIITDKDIVIAIKDGDKQIVDQLIDTKLENVKKSKRTKLAPNAHAQTKSNINVNEDDYKLAKKIKTIRDIFQKNRNYKHNVNKIDTHLSTDKGTTIDIIIQAKENERNLKKQNKGKSPSHSKKTQEEKELAKAKREAAKLQEAKDRKRREEIIILFETIQEREFEDLVKKLKNERDELESKTGKMDAKIDNTIAELDHISENLESKLELNPKAHISTKDKNEIVKQNSKIQKLSSKINDSENKLYEDLTSLKNILERRIDIVDAGNQKMTSKARRVDGKDQISYSSKNQPKQGDWLRPSPSPGAATERAKSKQR